MTLKNCIEPPSYVKYWQIFWSWILRTVSKFRKRKRELLSCVPVLYKRWNLALCNAGKEMYTNAWCTCRAVGFSNLNLLCFCRSRWSRRRRCLSSIIDGTSQWVVTCPGSSDRIRVLSVSIRLWVFSKNALNSKLNSRLDPPQVAQARNMSIGENRHCCLTFEI